MNAARKCSSILLLTFLVASILLVTQTASAQSKPSTPEFTVQYVDNSYDVPPTYGTDQFTGKTVITRDGYRVDGKSVLFKIQNQPFTSYNDSSGNTIDLYFNFRYKGHYGASWYYYPFSETGQGTCRYGSTFIRFTDEEPQIPQSGMGATEKSFTLSFLFKEDMPPVGTQVDFQVQALVGHIDYEGDGYFTFVGQTGGWSNIETLTVGTNQITTQPSPSPIPRNVDNETYLPAQPPTGNPTPSTEKSSAVYPIQQNTGAGAEFTFDWQTVVITVLAAAVAMLGAIVVFQRKKGR